METWEWIAFAASAGLVALLIAVLATRGRHVAVENPGVVEPYRHGHAMLETVEGGESTENLRKAMIDFRAVLDELLPSWRKSGIR